MASPGLAPLETMPPEILQNILGHFKCQPTRGDREDFTPAAERNKAKKRTLRSLMLTSKSLVPAAREILYNVVIVTSIRSLIQLFYSQITYPVNGVLVRVIDSSAFLDEAPLPLDERQRLRSLDAVHRLSYDPNLIGNPAVRLVRRALDDRGVLDLRTMFITILRRAPRLTWLSLTIPGGNWNQPSNLARHRQQAPDSGEQIAHLGRDCGTFLERLSLWRSLRGGPSDLRWSQYSPFLSLPNVKRLDLADFFAPRRTVMPPTKAFFPANIENVDLSRCRSISLASFSTMFQGLSKLRTLHLSDHVCFDFPFSPQPTVNWNMILPRVSATVETLAFEAEVVMWLYRQTPRKISDLFGPDGRIYCLPAFERLTMLSIDILYLFGQIPTNVDILPVQLRPTNNNRCMSWLGQARLAPTLITLRLDCRHHSDKIMVLVMRYLLSNTANRFPSLQTVILPTAAGIKVDREAVRLGTLTPEYVAQCRKAREALAVDPHESPADGSSRFADELWGGLELDDVDLLERDRSSSHGRRGEYGNGRLLVWDG